MKLIRWLDPARQNAVLSKIITRFDQYAKHAKQYAQFAQLKTSKPLPQWRQAKPWQTLDGRSWPQTGQLWASSMAFRRVSGQDRVQHSWHNSSHGLCLSGLIVLTTSQICRMDCDQGLRTEPVPALGCWGARLQELGVRQRVPQYAVTISICTICTPHFADVANPSIWRNLTVSSLGKSISLKAWNPKVSPLDELAGL